MLLCNTVGVTAVSTTFFVGFAFLKTEQQHNFSWALKQLSTIVGSSYKPQVVVTDRDLVLMNAVASVYQNLKHLLCTWHIDKNVKVQCWPFFRDAPTTAAGLPTELCEAFEANWKALVRSLTQVEYDQNWAAIRACHCRHVFTLNYIETVWLRDHREKFVYAWTYQHLYLGTVVTSCVERAHSLLKRYINVRTILSFYRQALIIIKWHLETY
jgi:histone-lysine N-methyltransferase SETD2